MLQNSKVSRCIFHKKSASGTTRPLGTKPLYFRVFGAGAALSDMADPLSIAAGVISLVATTVHAVRFLNREIQSIKDAPGILAALSEDLQLVEKAILAVSAIPSDQWISLGEDVMSYAETTLQKCLSACDGFRVELQGLTRGGERLSWRGRGRIGLWKRERIKDVSRQLQACHAMIASLASTATL